MAYKEYAIFKQLYQFFKPNNLC